MKGHLFRVTAENNEDVFREFFVPMDSTFEDFHFAILDAFRIESGEMASFYVSDENWVKKEEITLMDMGITDKKISAVLMEDTLIIDKIQKEETFFFYTYDFLFCKNFEVELIESAEENFDEVSLVKSEGRYVEDASAYEDFYLDDLDADDIGENPKKKKQKDGFDDLDEDNFNDDFDDDYNEKNYDNFDEYDL